MHDLNTYQLAVLSLGAMAAGLWLLVKGGDWTVDAAADIARRAGLSELFVAATIVAFGTSVPELFTSVNANLSGFPGLSLGNVMGSNVANVLFIIGTAAVIYAFGADRKAVRRDVLVMFAATAIFVVLLYTGDVVRWQGFVLVALLVGYVVMQYKLDPGALLGDDDEEENGDGAAAGGREPMGKEVLVLLGGLAALAAGSELLVQGAVAAGTAIGVPEAVIGLTVVAIGTSLPELATVVAAARKHRTGMIVGNIVGSNIFNILSIIGFTAAIKPIVVPDSVMGAPVWVMTGITVAFGAWLLAGARFTRPIGVAMLVAYVVFIAAQYGDMLMG